MRFDPHELEVWWEKSYAWTEKTRRGASDGEVASAVAPVRMARPGASACEGDLMNDRRPYGTGSLYVRRDRAGRENWYGHWRANGRQVTRRIGLKRLEGTRDGLTRTQAEAELRRLISETQVRPRVGARLSVDEVSRRYRLQAERLGRKRSTVQNIESEDSCAPRAVLRRPRD